MAIEGPLKELGIHDVFQLLDLNRKTGVLTVTSRVRHNHGVVYFDGGAVVHAGIQSNPHPLGGVLLKAGKITEADLHRGRAIQLQGDSRRLGEILVSMGSLSRRELERQVQLQIEEVVFEIMSWREGYFSFAEGPHREIPAEATARIPTESLLLEAARRIDEWSRIENRIPHLGMVPVLAPLEEGKGGRLDLLPSEWEVLAAIDGDRDLRAIARELARSEFEVARTVFGLESAGVIALVDRVVLSQPVADEGADLEHLYERVETALAAGDVQAAVHWTDSARARYPHEPVVSFLSGRINLIRGRAPEAEEEFRRALRLDPLIAPAHRFLGDALAHQGRFAEAVEWWERWLTLSEQSHNGDEEVKHVRDAVRAAQTLAGFLQSIHG
jgi:tetratricopeptide (TPR) repeat protein